MLFRSIKARNGLTGVTDFSGTDAFTVIQSAIDAMPNGGLIGIKAGSYVIPGQNTIHVGQNITIAGEGKFATIFDATQRTTDAAVFESKPHSNVENPNSWHFNLSDFRINLPRNAGNYGIGVNAFGVGLGRFENLDIDGGNIGFRLFGERTETGGQAANCIIQNCHFKFCKTGLFMDSDQTLPNPSAAPDNFVVNNKFSGITSGLLAYTSIGLDHRNAHGTYFHNTKLDGCGTAVRTGDGSVLLSNLVVETSRPSTCVDKTGKGNVYFRGHLFFSADVPSVGVVGIAKSGTGNIFGQSPQRTPFVLNNTGYTTPALTSSYTEPDQNFRLNFDFTSRYPLRTRIFVRTGNSTQGLKGVQVYNVTDNKSYGELTWSDTSPTNNGNILPIYNILNETGPKVLTLRFRHTGSGTITFYSVYLEIQYAI